MNTFIFIDSTIVYKKKGERIHALHEIAAGRKISDDLPIVKDYLYSISMMVKIRLINLKIYTDQ